MSVHLETGILYQNPSPHLKSIHAYFPSVVVTDHDEMLATVVLGEAFEAVDMHTWLLRSKDAGKTWQNEGRIFSASENSLISDYSRISKLPDGTLVILMMLADRSDHPDEGLANPETLGFVPARFVLFRSGDQGRTWAGPEPVRSPLGDTPLELCAPVTPAGRGTCFIPTSPWKKWDGTASMSSRMIALRSHDLGKTWPEYVSVMEGPEQNIQYWESKIIEISGNRLLAVAWAHHAGRSEDLPNQFAVSHDGGTNWSEPGSTGLTGQTLTPFLLGDGRILSVYRRMDQPGLWANISRIEGERWVNESSEPLWGHDAANLTGNNRNMVHFFNVLKFGAPSVVRSPDGKIFIAFWAVENCTSVIRWFKLSGI